MKSLIMIWTLLFALGSVQLSFAQAPDTLWTKTFGGEYNYCGYSVQQTTDGGYIIAGSTDVFGSDRSDVWLIKTDALGDTVWTKTFGGESWDMANSVQQTTDGGYILIGSTESFASGGQDVWLIKTDESGDTLWTKTFGGDRRDYGHSVQQTTDGGYFLVGWTMIMRGIEETLFIKTDSMGDTVWTSSLLWGSGNSGLQTSDGGYIIAGYTNSFGSGDRDVWLIKTDVLGDTLWTKTFGGESWDMANSVQQTTDGGYIITGRTGSYGSGGEDIWLIKTDVLGDTLWTKTFGGESWDMANSVQQTTDGGYIITGWTESYGSGENDVWLIKTDSLGNKLWTKTYGGKGYDVGNTVQQTSDDGYIIVGNTTSFGPGYHNIWLIKLAADPVGNIIHDENALPETYKLYQNYPDPFNPITNIEYTVRAQRAVPLQVNLSIYNLLGQKVATLVNKKQPAGNYNVQWDATGFATGVYYYKIEADEYSEVKKMILIR